VRLALAQSVSICAGDRRLDFYGEEVKRVTSLYLRLRELLNREEGQGMVEYALILVLIAVVVIAILIILGNQVKNVFCNISGGLGQ
jgi:pilus assembly protein Flp/PilA